MVASISARCRYQRFHPAPKFVHVIYLIHASASLYLPTLFPLLDMHSVRSRVCTPKRCATLLAWRAAKASQYSVSAYLSVPSQDTALCVSGALPKPLATLHLFGPLFFSSLLFQRGRGTRSRGPGPGPSTHHRHHHIQLPGIIHLPNRNQIYHLPNTPRIIRRV